MEVYKYGDKWIVGLEGGNDGNKEIEPEAVIFNKRPVPLRKWTTPIEKINYPFVNEVWANEYTFREFQGDHDCFYLLEINNTRVRPNTKRRYCEYFITREHLENKLEELRNKNSVNSFYWIPEKRTWVDLERTFEEDVFEAMYYN